MPGIRLGYCLSGSSELITALHQSGQDWNVSILAQEAGKAALKEHEYLAKSFKLIEQERSYLRNRLAALGAKVYARRPIIFSFICRSRKIFRSCCMSVAI